MKRLSRSGAFITAVLLAASMRAQSTPLAASPLQPPPQSSESATVIVPAGTKVLMTSLAPLNAISANSESGLYLETLMDVIEQNRLVIPAGSFVQGSVI